MTMREEFEAHRTRLIKTKGLRAMVLQKSGNEYLHRQVQEQWDDWQAAYAAGQRAEREAIRQEVASRQVHRMGSAADYDKGALRALQGLETHIELRGHLEGAAICNRKEQP